MSWEQIQTTLIGLAVSAIVGIVGRWFNVKLSAEQQRQATWAIEQGVAYVALKLRAADGEEKQAEALSIAHSLAPKAMSKLGARQKVVLADSTYAKLRASLPQPEPEAGSVPVDLGELSDTLPKYKGPKPS